MLAGLSHKQKCYDQLYLGYIKKNFFFFFTLSPLPLINVPTYTLTNTSLFYADMYLID